MFCSSVFLSAETLSKFCICGLCWPVCERTLWTLYWYVRVRMSCVMIFFKMQWLSACIQVRCDYITIHYLWIGCDTTDCLLYIWRRVSCLMESHVGPRAGCGCCMPCEVVACIVVLPLPVGNLPGISCLLLVGIYLHDLPQIFGFCLHLCIPRIYSGFSPFLSTWSFMSL